MNIVLFGYYGFADGYFAYGRYFSKYFETVSFFPLIELERRVIENDKDKTINDIEICISGGDLSNKKYSHNLINHNVPKNIIIIAHNNEKIATLKINNMLVIEYLNSLKERYHFQLIQLNWDVRSIINNYDYISNYFDMCFYSDPNYLPINPINSNFFTSGYSPITSYYDEDDNYKCDVSFIGTNLYTNPIFPNQHLNRRMILDRIYNDKSIKLHVYGPTFLQNLYPESYKGLIRYNNSYKVFSNSKINLNISPMNEIYNEGYYYYSERMPQIIGCNGVMLCNNNYGDLLTPDIDYIYVNTIDELIPKIKRVLNDEEYYNSIKENVIRKKDIFNYEILMEDFCYKIKNFYLNRNV
jgi:hypothetical protein